MKYQKSCGAVLFTRSNNDIYYVIIRSISNEYGFPKGHMEPGESEKDTALREIFEEVGLRPVIGDHFRKEIQYLYPGKPDVTKISVYFLAEFSNQDFTLQPEEVLEVKLLPYEEARCILTFQETKNILDNVHSYLTNPALLKPLSIDGSSGDAAGDP